jgi:hypothetical protein
MVPSRIRAAAIVAAALFFSVVTALPLAAQVRTPKPTPKPDNSRWEIEGHVFLGGSDPTSGGEGKLPPAGQTFQTAGGTDSRRVPSWYFGDGAKLLNDVLQTLGRSERLTAMDSVLTGVSAEQSTGSGFGLRVTHYWKPKLTIEAGVEFSQASYVITQGARNGLRAASDSFIVAFSGLAASAQGAAFINPQISSTNTLANGTGAEILATGALVLEFRKGKRWRPYFVGGGGVALGTGGASATFEGRYRFGLPSSAQVDESDRLTVRFAGGMGMVFLGGAGVKFRLWRQFGVQGDARALAVENHLNTVVDARPSIAESLPADALWLNLAPSIQFVTHPSTGHSSSLGAGGLSGFKTFAGSGFQPRYTLSVGGYVRF